MKKFLASIFAVLMIAVTLFGFVGCGGDDGDPTGNGDPTDPGDVQVYDYDAIPDTMTSADGKYELAMVTDVGQLKDKGFNQGTWEGLKRYAHENNKSYKYYQPENGEQATDADRVAAMVAAINNGAKVIVTPGFLQGTAIMQTAPENKDVKFIFIDGVLEDLPRFEKENVIGVSFNEEEAGYFAGYAAVMEGFTKLGFVGGGGGSNPPVNRFGWGYVQGANAAALEKGVNVTMKYTYKFGTAFAANADLQTMVNGWYQSGTEVVFSCGGSMFDSVKAAAASYANAKVIGVDVDQSNESSRVITSAIKGLREAVIKYLGIVDAGQWDTVGGKDISLGAKDGATGLMPGADNWLFGKFTFAQYQAIFQKVVNGEVVIERYPENYSSGDLSLSKVIVDYVE